MKPWLAFFLLLFSVLASADEVTVPPLTARVTDLTGTLSADQRAALEDRLKSFEAEKGSQIAVLMVNTTQPEEIEQYSIRVVEQWKLGRKNVDDGVLLLIAKDDHKLRIEVGYGLEGAMPDMIAKRIIAEDIAPHFKQGDFYGGIVVGITRITGVLQGEPLPAPGHSQQSDMPAETYLPMLLIFALIGGAILSRLLGTLPGALVNGGLIGIATVIFGGGMFFAIVFGIMAFVFALMRGGGGWGGGSFGGGGHSSGGGGGGFSGGGGGFAGGGASGNW